MTEAEIEYIAQQYVVKRYKESDNQRYFNVNACKRDFVAGIKFTLEFLKLQNPK